MGTMKHLWVKHSRALIGVAVLIAGAGSAAGYKRYKKSHEVPPALESPARGDIEVRFKDSGDVGPKVFVDVASKVSGRLIELKAEEGTEVKKGQPLGVIQPGKTEAERYVPSTLLSPLSGTVMRYVPQGQSYGGSGEGGKFPRIGDYVTGLFDSQTPTYLMTVSDLSRMIVKMQISEMDILKLAPLMPVSVTVDAIEGKTFPAKVGLISPQAEKNSNGLKVFKVEVELGETDSRLKPGMTARVDALLQSKKGVLKLPLSTVFEEMGKTFVYVEVPGSKPRKTEVHLGLRSELDAELLAPAPVTEKDKLLTEKPAEKPPKT